jgi:hypothetical protein
MAVGQRALMRFMVDMPDDVASVVDSEVDAYWTEWPKPRQPLGRGLAARIRSDSAEPPGRSGALISTAT